ncbi:hypothetical protein ACFLU5_04560 [Bacteroidota bacterium]
MAPPKLNIRLLNLNCYTTGESGDDEVFLKLDGKKIWPVKGKYVSMKTDKVELRVEIPDIEKGSMVEIELWDYDLFSPNDKIGVFKLQVDGQGGPFIAEMIRNEKESSIARYNMDWEIF